MRLGAIAAMVALALAVPGSAAKGDPAPLFSDTVPIAVTITGPVKDIVRKADRSTVPQAATLTANGETFNILLSARGLSRRTNCKFPPLLVDFSDKPGDASLFEKQGKLKLVTHCQSQGVFDRYVLREYAAYKLYNVLTPKSLNVRLAQVRYMDGTSEVANRVGFFIEDIDDAAKRMGGKELDVPKVSSAALDPDDAARYVLFQYMIGNLDWDMSNGPEGSDCCHNSKLVGATAEARTALIPVAYDFDYAGIVNPPYAMVPEGIPVRTVAQRYYRGLCRHNDAVQKAAVEFLALRPAFEAALAGIAEIEPKERDNLRKYIAPFFDEIATPDLVEKKILKKCR